MNEKYWLVVKIDTLAHLDDLFSLGGIIFTLFLCNNG